MKLLIPPPIVAMLTVFAMWIISRQFDVLMFDGPKILAYAFIIIGASLDFIAIFAFRKAKTTVTPLKPEKASQLVVTGLYRYTRNPMYLGLLFILSGLAILFGSALNIVMIVIFVAYITAFQIKPEEERLMQLFGAPFTDYMKKVRRWI